MKRCLVCGCVVEDNVEKCPQCGNMLFIKKGRKQLVCHEKECGYKKDITDGENEQS